MAVVGGGISTAADEQAEEVGRLLAEAGAVVLTGGLGGVMAAASRGAKGAGGLVVGILPGSDRAAANEHVDVALATGMGEMRNALIVRSADAVIAIGGEYGTLSEIAFALKTDTRVVSLGSWDLVAAGADAADLLVADSPEEAVRLALGA